jgi:lysozyme
MLEWKQENEVWFCYKDGKKVKGWIQDDMGRWFHLNDKDGSVDTGFFQTATDNNFWFYAYKEKTEKYGNTHYAGEMATDWIQDGNGWYYFNVEKTTNYGIEYPMGSMMVDWFKINSKWYYFLIEKTEYNSDTHYTGEMVSDTTITINGKEYTFNADGSLNEGSSSDTLLSSAGAEFIGSWEGLFTTAYEDPYYPGNSDWWTIGYGTTYKVTPSAFPNGLASTCTKEQAVAWLQEEAESCAETIKANLDANNVSLTQNELDACISFAYNCGTGGLTGSTFYKNVLAGVRDSSTITTNLQAWSKANGATSAGLLKRRNSEAALFLNADYTGNN